MTVILQFNDINHQNAKEYKGINLVSGCEDVVNDIIKTLREKNIRMRYGFHFDINKNNS